MRLTDYLVHKARSRSTTHREAIDWLIAARYYSSAAEYLKYLEPKDLDQRIDA